MKDKEIKIKLRKRFPDGFTTILTWGKTRTFYSLIKYKRAKEEATLKDDFDPGKLDSMTDYAETILDLYGKHLTWLREFGVSDIVLTALHYEAWRSRGKKYRKEMILNLPTLIDDYIVKYYKKGFNVYFLGIEQVFRTYDKSSEEYNIGLKLQDFENNWIQKNQTRIYLLSCFLLTNIQS